MYCPSGNEEWSTEPGLSEPPAPPPPGSLVQSAGFVVGLDEFDGGESRSPVGVLDQSMLDMRLAGDFYNVPENVPRGVSLVQPAGFVAGLGEFDGDVSRSSVGVLDQSMLDMRLAGDFYNVPENVPRGVQLDDPGMFHTHFGGEEDAFRLDTAPLPFKYDQKPGRAVQKAQDFPELSFPAHVTPAQEPLGGCLNTCVELRNITPQEAFKCVFNFFKTKASASFSKVTEKKLAMKATVFHTSCSGVLVSCLLKARVFSAAADPSKLLLEFRRCSGDAIAFAHAFDEASKHLRSSLMADQGESHENAHGDNISATGEEHSLIQPLVDMVAAGSPSTMEAEAVAALAALALSADPAGTTALLAALRDVQKILVELCVNRKAIDTAYPAARLVSKLVCKSNADEEAQQMACELTRAVCGATHLDSLVRGELAEAVRAVANRTMQFPMQHELAQALQTLEEPGPAHLINLQDGVMA